MRYADLLPIFLFSVCVACGPLPGPVDPPAVPTCETACDRARVLNCAYAHPTAAGASCVEVCENVQTSGFLKWDLGCRSVAASCAAIDACER